jgi:hypothetical protein
MPKDPISTRYTRAAISQIKDEINGISRLATLIVQLLTMGYYGAMIYMNYQDLFRVIVYSISLVVTLVAYIVSLVLTDDKKAPKDKRRAKTKIRRRAKLVFKIINYVARTAAVTYAFYVLSRYGGSELALILTVLSAVLILINLLIDFIIYLGGRYGDYLSVAVEADIASSGIVNMAQKVSNPWQTFSDMTERWADRSEGTIRVEEEDVYVARVKGKLSDKADDIIAENKERKERRRQERKAANKLNRQKIKENFKRIFRNLFKRKKKDKDIQ